MKKPEPKIEIEKVEVPEIKFKQFTTKDLKKMSHKELVNLADQMATKLMFLHEAGKTEEDYYGRLAGELFHVSEIIDWKKMEKKKKPKVNYGK